MDPKNRLAEIFAKLGLHKPRPTDEQLETWGISSKRFMQLFENRGTTPITVPEERVLRAWLKENFTGQNVYLFEDEVPKPVLSPKQGQLQLQ